MNNEHEDNLLHDLYQQGNKELPPAALDDIILNQAKQAKRNHTTSNKSHSKKSWRPWLAAASVVLVLPMVWFLTQNQQITPDFGSASSVETPKPTAKKEAFTNDTIAEEGASYKPQPEAELAEMDDASQDRITVTGNRMRSEPAESPAPVLDLEDKIETQALRSISGKPIDQESLQANMQILKDEFKAKKRTIKPSTMDPLMALEYEQFGRYLELGDIEKADQLLTEMQESWPDFDFEDMIYRLAEAEIGAQ